MSHVTRMNESCCVQWVMSHTWNDSARWKAVWIEGQYEISAHLLDLRYKVSNISSIGIIYSKFVRANKFAKIFVNKLTIYNDNSIVIIYSKLISTDRFTNKSTTYNGSIVIIHSKLFSELLFEKSHPRVDFFQVSLHQAAHGPMFSKDSSLPNSIPTKTANLTFEKFYLRVDFFQVPFDRLAHGLAALDFSKVSTSDTWHGVAMISRLLKMIFCRISFLL